MINRFLGVAVLIVFLLGGCAKKPNLYTSDEIMQEFSPNLLDFEYLTARGRIVIEEANGKTTKGTINLRVKNDSIIWFSVTPGLGLEAFRGAITKDKFRIKDRLNGEDINMNYVEVMDRFDLNLSLELFQNLIFANVPHDFSFRDRLIRIGQYFELTQARDNVRYHSRVSTRHGKVMELNTTSMEDKGSMLVSYPTFEDVDNQPFPNKMLMRVSFNTPDGVQTAIINLEMTRIELVDSPLSFPFQF